MRVLTVALVAAVASLHGPGFAGEGRQGLAQGKDREAYALGYQFGEGLRRQGFDAGLKLLIQGIRDAVGGAEALLGPDERNEVVLGLKKRLALAQEESRGRQREENLRRGKAFLEENGKAAGVVTLPSDLQYRVVAEGSGRAPAAEDTVTVHYRGTLVDGTPFDRSYERGTPETVRVDGVVAGWAEALPRMKEGAKWMLFLPPDLAYGARGQGSRIPPNSTLIFELELLRVL